MKLYHGLRHAFWSGPPAKLSICGGKVG